MLKLVLFGAVLIAAAMAQAADVCVLEVSNKSVSDPYKADRPLSYTETFTSAACTIATDSAMIQNVKVEWTQDTACTGYEPVACFYPSVATVQNLVTIGQAKAQIIQALLAKGYAVASDNILTK